MTWWGTQLGGDVGGSGEPKRKYKFLVELGPYGYLYSLNSIAKPTATVQNNEYQLINHHFSYPGTVKWESITMNLVDFGSQSPLHLGGNASSLWKILTNSGYSTPSSAGGLNTLEKGKSGVQLGPIVISQIGSDQTSIGRATQVKVTEQWILHNPIIEKISWGDLSYAEEGFVEYELSIKYDWPEYVENPAPLLF